LIDKRDVTVPVTLQARAAVSSGAALNEQKFIVATSHRL